MLPLRPEASRAEPKIREARVSLVSSPSSGCRGGGGVTFRVRIVRRDQSGVAVTRAGTNRRAMDHGRFRGKDGWPDRPRVGKASTDYCRQQETPESRVCCRDARRTRHQRSRKQRSWWIFTQCYHPTQQQTRQAATRSSRRLRQTAARGIRDRHSSRQTNRSTVHARLPKEERRLHPCRSNMPPKEGTEPPPPDKYQSVDGNVRTFW
ncbi:unnamed protein product [Laminaria digitata]